jgi:hypothetical protein
MPSIHQATTLCVSWRHRRWRCVRSTLSRGSSRFRRQPARPIRYDTGDDVWLWLDRDHNRLCGPDLADHLAWCEAGQRLRLEWTPEVIVVRLLDVDPEVQREEARLVDLEALAELRGGLGESYRRSLQIVLSEAPDGLTFADVVEALRARQGHEVHRGTVRALLSSGGFVRRDGRWFVAPDDADGARRLRRALVQTLTDDRSAPSAGRAISPSAAATIGAICARLTEIIAELEATKAATQESIKTGRAARFS